jgi:hypothetical protein
MHASIVFQATLLLVAGAISSASAVYVGCYSSDSVASLFPTLAYVASGNNSAYVCTQACFQLRNSFLGVIGDNVSSIYMIPNTSICV